MADFDNTLRLEEPWLVETEELLQQWSDESRIQADKHDAAGNACKRSHIRWALPNALIPVIISPIAAIVEKDTVWWFQYVEAALILATGACGVMTNFLVLQPRLKSISALRTVIWNWSQTSMRRYPSLESTANRLTLSHYVVI